LQERRNPMKNLTIELAMPMMQVKDLEAEIADDA
jgi:hypothetical protein